MAQPPAIFIGNLRADCHKADLHRAIFSLLTNHLNIELQHSDIEIKGKANLPKHAFVNLRSKREVHEVCMLLGSLQIRPLLQTEFPNLVEPSRNLRLGHKRPKIKEKYYEYEQKLGNETRDKEFKEGGGNHYVKKNLRDHVCKYLCGFLNSSQAGTLYIGVRDDGSVVGIDCDQKKEDKIRLKIDQSIKTFKPPLFPKNYSVNFIAIYQDGQIIADQKVLEISVDKINEGNPTKLYEAGGQAYIRRDGSIHTLTPSEIQEWSNEVHKRELQSELKRQKEELMRKDEKRIRLESQKRKEQDEKDEELKKLQQKIAQLMEENKNLQKKQSNKKSKVCVIS